MGRHTVAVIGAGPAGLAAARELAEHGAQPLVLDKGDKVGGLSRTETYRDYRFDIGGHRFYTRIAHVEALWRQTLADDLLTVRRLSRIRYDGRFFNYPLELSNTLGNLGIAESLLIVMSYLRARMAPHRREETFEQWVTNRFGARLFRTFFQAYTEKIWGIPCGEIRADWAAQRIGSLSMMTAIRNALFGTNGAKTLISEFLYPALGPGMMWESFERRATTAGATVRLGGEVVRVNHDGRRITSLVVRQDGQDEEVQAEQFISSMPLAELIARMSPGPPADVIRAAAGLKYRSFILVGLIAKRPDVFPDNWIYVHEPTVRVGRVQNFKNWSAAMVPDPARTCLGMEYFCNRGDGLWTMPDPKLIDLAAGELGQLGLVRLEDVEDGAVVREAAAYPVYDSGYHRNLCAVRRYLETFGNLQTVGRNGMHRYNNQDHSMLTGILAARNVLGEKHDVWQADTDA